MERADGEILMDQGTIVSGVRWQKGKRRKGMDFLRFDKLLILDFRNQLGRTLVLQNFCNTHLKNAELIAKFRTKQK